MLKGQLHKQGRAREADWSLLVFSIGGNLMATRTDEVGGVRLWTETMPVPGTTPYVNALIRYEEEVLPVYDMAAHLQQEIKGDPFCLIAKRTDGPLAVCIDGLIPVLTSVAPSAVEPLLERHSSLVGHFHLEGERIPIYSFANLGSPTPQTV